MIDFSALIQERKIGVSSVTNEVDNSAVRSGGKLAIVGLGYVGLPLAVEFGKKRTVVGFDINAKRVAELKAGHDYTGETDAGELAQAKWLTFSTEVAAIADCTVYIVTVPTPIDQHKRPDLTPLIHASETIGGVLKRGDIVIYESTVYPGATEDDCVPVLERTSGLKYNVDFFAGYSPERINPGDKVHRLTTIKKVTSGSTPETADVVDALYREIITAGTHKAPSIKTAEASKVIENTQRDVNIALMNEFAHVFNRLGIDTQDVLAAASTKWNFLPFKPGLVGGHCIGVDPYYLIQKAQAAGYYPDLLIAARRVNDAMGGYVASEVVKLMIQRGMAIKNSKVLMLGFSFKENCPDLRNTRVVDLVRQFVEYGAHVDVCDPCVDPEEAFREYAINVAPDLPATGSYDAVVIAVSHNEYRAAGPARIRNLCQPQGILYDAKALFARGDVDGRL